jgi:hypothetical protein
VTNISKPQTTATVANHGQFVLLMVTYVTAISATARPRAAAVTMNDGAPLESQAQRLSAEHFEQECAECRHWGQSYRHNSSKRAESG